MKAQLHIHIKGDPLDDVKHSWKNLIDRAKTLEYKILAITAHNKVIFPAEAKEYAKQKNILLIKGIEVTILKKHIIILNADNSAEQIHSFPELAEYKAKHPESFIMAAHPFFPFRNMRNLLEDNIHLFDAIEYSYFVIPGINFNKKSKVLAKKYDLPVIATSDCHFLRYLDVAYTNLTPATNTLPTSPAELFATLKTHQFTNHNPPLNPFLASLIFLRMSLINWNISNLILRMEKFCYNQSICTNSFKKSDLQPNKIQRESYSPKA